MISNKQKLVKLILKLEKYLAYAIIFGTIAASVVATLILI